MHPPVVGHSTSPAPPTVMRPVDVGMPIADTAPTPTGTLLCRCNGEWLSRESWGSLTRDGDVVEWIELPQNKDLARLGLTLAAMYFLGPAGGLLTGFQSTVAIFAATLAINALLPPTLQQQSAGPGNTSDSFSTSLQGNAGRLGAPIWKTCGRREITPPFAGQPYFEYRPKVGTADPNLDNDQYYYALFAIGIGNHEISAKIGNTPISRFADVLRADYLPPGTPPTEVLANVTTAGEVSSQVLDSGRYVGGFAACAPGRTCASVGIDVVATRGLGSGEDARTVSWRVEYRPINDFGQALGAWAALGTESRTAYTSSPQRWSTKYTLGTAARVEIRIVRTDVKDASPSALHEIAWTGLRAYLAEPAPLNEHTAHLEVVMRASSQLSQSASRDVRVITKAFTRTLNADLEWQAEEHTRVPAWWILDLATSDTWGIGKPDDRVDLQSFYDLAQVNIARQDRCDWTFDSSVNAWDAMQLLARTCRSRVFRRNGVISIARDELADLPVTAFTPRNCSPGMCFTQTMRQRNSPDGFVIEYQDHRTWEWTSIDCPCPGVTTMVNPVIKRIEGICGATHAHREGLYEVANLLYRPRIANWKTEMQGMLPAYMSPVDWLPDIVGYGHSGDVAFWDAGTKVMGLTAPADFSGGTLYLTLIRDGGTLTDPVLVLPGPTEYDVVLPAAPDFTLVLDDGTRERPKYLLGVKETVKVLSITDGGKDGDAQMYAMTGVIDDERVHTADVALLPGPGVEQDPVGEPDDDAGGGTIYIVDVVDVDDRYVRHISGGAHTTTYTLHSDGTTWLRFAPFETSVTGRYEVRATLLDGAFDTGTFDTWMQLNTDRSWSCHGDVSHWSDGTMLIEVRSIADGIIQDSATVRIRIEIDDSGS